MGKEAVADVSRRWRKATDRRQLRQEDAGMECMQLSDVAEDSARTATKALREAGFSGFEGVHIVSEDGLELGNIASFRVHLQDASSVL